MGEKQNHEVMWTTERPLNEGYLGQLSTSEAKIKVWKINEYDENGKITNEIQVIKREPQLFDSEHLPHLSPELIRNHREKTAYKDFETLQKIYALTDRVPKPIKLSEINNYRGETAKSRTSVVMEYIEGPDLSAYLEETYPTSQEFALLMVDITNTAEIMYKTGYTYKDWKPDSIIMDKNKDHLPRIIDITTSPLITYTHDYVTDIPNVTPETATAFMDLTAKASTENPITESALPTHTQEDEIQGLCKIIKDTLEFVQDGQAKDALYELISKVLRRELHDPKNPEAPTTLADLKKELIKISEIR